MNKIPLTVEGAALLREELDQLKRIERPRIVQAIAEARAHGDLKENAEYHAAREQQSFTEGRINELEGKLGNAQVIDVTRIPAGDKVIFGATVTIINSESDEETTYKIVGDDEADIKENKISVYSPIARALVGKSEGDAVVVKAPSGDIEYEIEEVQHI